MVSTMLRCLRVQEPFLSLGQESRPAVNKLFFFFFCTVFEPNVLECPLIWSCDGGT